MESARLRVTLLLGLAAGFDVEEELGMLFSGREKMNNTSQNSRLTVTTPTRTY